MELIQCNKCHQEKPLSDFHKLKGNKYRKTCKLCIREYDKSPIRKKRHNAWRNSPKGKLRIKQYNNENKEEIRLRKRAQNAVHVAIRNKILKRKPCEICGNLKAQAHHEDYNEPLEVKWLCQSCHYFIDN